MSTSEIEINIDQDRHIDPEFTYKEDGSAVDISGAELTFSVFSSRSAISATFTKQNTAGGGGDDEISWVTDGSDGKFYVHILPADTTSLSTTVNYHWEIKMTLSSKDTTIGKGILTINRVMIS